MNAGNAYSSMSSVPVITYKELSLGERSSEEEKGERPGSYAKFPFGI